MAFTNYTTFIAVVADYLARTDLTSQIPDFVNLAQNRMSRDLRVRQMLKVATTDTTGGDSTIALPAVFSSASNVQFSRVDTAAVEEEEEEEDVVVEEEEEFLL